MKEPTLASKITAEFLGTFVLVFGGGDALAQVWAFFLAPLAGAAVAGLLYNVLFPKATDVPITEGG